jgi:hypothetical protein
MKTISLIAAMFLTAAFAGPAAEAGRIPFNGTIEASEINQFFGDPPFGFIVNAGGTATTTQLGQFTVAYSFVVLFIETVPNTAPGASCYIAAAANGDTIQTVSTGEPFNTPDPDVISIVETHTITGGSGRYAGAKGSFTLNRSLNLVTGATTGSFNGTIIVRGNQ